MVAELCPLGYCTESYRRMAPQLGLTYLRWTNTIQSNAVGADTVVDVPSFLSLMRNAVRVWKAPSTPMTVHV